MDFLEIARFALEQAPIVAGAGVLYAVGQVAKLITPPPETNGGWLMFHRTLPFHPVAAGILGGLAYGNVTNGALAGLLACYGHDIYVTWTKHSKEP